MAPYPQSFRLPRGPIAYRDGSRVAAYLDVPLQRGEAAIDPAVESRLAAAGLSVAPEPANHGPRLIWFRTHAQRRAVDVDALERALRRKFRWVAPAYRLKDVDSPAGLFCARADRILLRADPNNTQRLQREIARLGLTDEPHVTTHLKGWCYTALPRPRRRPALELALTLHDRTPWLEVDLEYIPFVSPWAAEPGDRYYSQERPEPERVRGGELVTLDGRRAVRMDRQKMLVALKTPRPGRHAMHLVVELPAAATSGDEFLFTVQQRLADGRFTGGADFLLRLQAS